MHSTARMILDLSFIRWVVSKTTAHGWHPSIDVRIFFKPKAFLL